jgi:Tol biopolymer transport system component
MFKSLTYGCVCLTFVTGCSSSPHSATAVDKRQSFPTRDITPEVIPASTLPPILSTPTPYDPCAAPASRDPSPMSIIFSANWDGDFEIYTIHADGSNLNQLTNNTIDDITPLWSPDGEKIAFVSKVSKNPGRVNVMNSDGTKQMPITNDDFAITTSAWSPDSRNIAFEGVRNGLADFYIVDINNPSPIKVSDSEAYYGLGNLAWSPDSNNLAYDVWLDKHGALRGVILVRLDRLDVQTLMPQPYKESAEIYSDSLPEWDPSNDLPGETRLV